MTLIDDFEVFQAAQSLSPRTIMNRRYILGPLQRFLDVPLEDATTADLRRYLARGGVKPSTLRIERAAMVAFYGFLTMDNIRADDPTEKLVRVRVPKNQPRPFTRDQIEAMLNAGSYRRSRTMILLGYYQGFRVSQIACVRGDDISGDQIRTIAKGGKSRWLPLHPAVELIAASMPDDWWFPSPYRAGPIKSESVTDAITSAKLRAGITDPTLTPHSLRHSFGSELVEQGVDIRVIQELMLHDDLGTTQVYAAVSPKRRAAGISTLPSLEAPSRSNRAIRSAA